jgi:predicted DNA-binding transcriptional regulator AlpA
VRAENPLEAIRLAGEAALALPTAEIPVVLGELERLKGLLWVRLNEPTTAPPASEDGDRLLGVPEAAAKLGMSISTLYKTADEYPFTVRQGRRVKFSKARIERFIADRADF